MQVAEVWARLLSPVIPRERLQECFDIAFRNHTSTFPITAYDLQAAWRSMAISGCDICLNHPDKDMITVKGGGFICDRQKGTVERCICNPKNGTT